MYAPHSNRLAKTLVTTVFYRFLVNNSNFFVIFMSMLPKNMSPINIENISVRHQRMAKRITGQTDLVFLLVKIALRTSRAVLTRA